MKWNKRQILVNNIKLPLWVNEKIKSKEEKNFVKKDERRLVSSLIEWDKEEVDYLINLCYIMNFSYMGIADRYNYGGVRRHYREIKEQVDKMFGYDKKNHFRKIPRHCFLKNALRRTKEQVDRERNIIKEMKPIYDSYHDILKKRSSIINNYAKDLIAFIEGITMVGPEQEREQNIKSNKNINKNIKPQVVLQSSYLNYKSQRSSRYKSIERVLQEYNLPKHFLIPTGNLVKLYKKIIEEATKLVDLRRSR